MRSILTVFVLLFFFLSAAAQDTVKLNTIIAKTTQVAETRPIEKVYLHFDKPYYAVNDTVWFKAYVTAGLHQPSELSKVLYVEILNSRDSLVKTLTLPLTDGATAGSIPLTEPSFKQNSYHIKAYTKWMLNFEQAYFFHKTINVGSAEDREISTFIALKRSLKNNVPIISSEITFKDSEGKPYSNRRVTWNVASGLFNAITDGKGTTDQNGVLNISFPGSKSADLSKAVLTTTLEGKFKAYESVFSLKSVALPADVQFFPEGGNLINGIPTKVAVKAVQANGLGADFTAAVTDNTGSNVVNFSSQHAGMGLFVLTPQSGKTYKVNLDFKDGTKGTYDLPKAQTGGLTMAINNSDTSKVVLKLMADSVYLKGHLNNKYYLLGKSGQVICYAAQISLTNAVTTASIASNKFPTGIAQFTLMTLSGQPVSERIAFIRHQDQLGITINSDKKSYGIRQRVQLDVLTKNNQAPAGADLSISVVDETKVPSDENSEITILSTLLLTSDLQGYIENPNYYFNQITEKKRSDLDLLMLTQGYRRFIYEDILGNKIPNVAFLPESGLEITGILRTLNGMPYKSGRVTLQIPDRYYSAEVVTDVQGRFKFPNLVFAGLTEMAIHARNNVDSRNMMLTLDGAVYSAVDKNPTYPDERLNIDMTMSSYLQNARKAAENSRVLKEVVVTAKAPVKKPSFADYPALTGLNSMNSEVIDEERLKGCGTILNCVRSMATGVIYNEETKNFYVSRDFNLGRKVPMAIYIRGIREEAYDLLVLNATDVASIEVFVKDELGLVNRANGTNGVLVVNLKPEAPNKGTKVTMQQLKDIFPQPNVLKMSLNGYTVSKHFYSPKYLPGVSSFGPDFRSTIYWNPHLSTDNTGKGSVEFYSSDGKGTYRAIVEGIDKDGHIGYSIYRFKVE